MELKVWVEGIQRIICGVTVNTTCQDVVFALAHATGQVGRFTLIERWRNNERLLAPNENPLQLLLKWGEYANDVQFILKRIDTKQHQHQKQNEHSINNNIGNDKENSTTVMAINKKPALATVNNFIDHNQISNSKNNSNCNNDDTNLNKSNNILDNNNKNNGSDMLMKTRSPMQQRMQKQQQQQLSQNMEINLNTANERAKELKKCFGSIDSFTKLDNVGIVKGVPQNSNHNNRSNNDINNDDNMPTVVYMNSNQYYEMGVKASNDEITELRDNMKMIHHEKSHSNPIDITATTMVSQQQEDCTKNEQQQQRKLNNSDKSIMKGNKTNKNSHNNDLYKNLGAQNSKSINEINLAEVRSALDRDTAGAKIISPLVLSKSNSTNIIDSNDNNKNDIMFTKTPASVENLMDIFQNDGKGNGIIQVNDNHNHNKILNVPIISANGALVPPPYRDPPPPCHSPLQLNHSHIVTQHQQKQSATTPMTSIPVSTSQAITYLSNSKHHVTNSSQIPTTTTAITKVTLYNSHTDHSNENDYEIIDYERFHTDDSKSIFPAAQYHDLLQLIKYQREKITTQQKELNKYDAEIVYLEAKERDQVQELESISREITLVDQLFRQGNEQLQTLQYVEEENELVKQQEKTLKSEIALLRSKLSNCETELLQCKNKIRLLIDDLEIEQRTINSKQNKKQHIERDFLMEIERIQSEIEQAIHNTDTSNKSAENLKKEILLIENAIAEKKRQVEQLVNEMKEVNLQSLTVTTSDEIKHFLEGSNKPGSSRRIIGSPRQLENAVPTSKNPHGVWV